MSTEIADSLTDSSARPLPRGSRRRRAEEVRKHFPGKVFAAMVPRNVRLSEAPSHGRPVTAYDKHSRGAEAYRQLAKECILKEGRP